MRYAFPGVPTGETATVKSCVRRMVAVASSNAGWLTARVSISHSRPPEATTSRVAVSRAAGAATLLRLVAGSVAASGASSAAASPCASAASSESAARRRAPMASASEGAAVP